MRSEPVSSMHRAVGNRCLGSQTRWPLGIAAYIGAVLLSIGLLFAITVFPSNAANLFPNASVFGVAAGPAIRG